MINDLTESSLQPTNPILKNHASFSNIPEDTEDIYTLKEGVKS